MKWRKPRRKLFLGKEHRKSRKTWCRKNMKRKVGFWRSVTFIDNKSWCAPTTKKASKTIQEKRVRGMYRTRGQGFEEGCTREGFKHRTAAPTIHATNVISGGAIKVMKIGEKWDGAAAARMFKRLGKILRGQPRSRRIVYADNDTRYHCAEAKAAAKSAKLTIRGIISSHL